MEFVSGFANALPEEQRLAAQAVLHGLNPPRAGDRARRGPLRAPADMYMYVLDMHPLILAILAWRAETQRLRP